MKTKFYKSKLFVITLGYIIILISFYFVIFTYSESISLIASTIVSIFVLIYIIKSKPGIFSIFFSFLLLAINITCFIIDIQNSLQSNTHVESLFVKSERREFRYYIPIQFNLAPNKLCIIALHGFMQTAQTMERLTRFNYYADTLNFAVVYPEGYKKSWNDGDNTKPATRDKIDDIAFLSKIISRLKAEYYIEKFYLTGFSNGGFLAVDAACSLNFVIDGFAVVAAGTWEGNISNCNSSLIPKSMFILMKEDPFTKWKKFGNSVANYLEKIGCINSVTVDTILTDNNFTLIDYQCTDQITREAIIKDGGHIWPGGEQYLPSFMIGDAIQNVDASKLILDFLFSDI